MLQLLECQPVVHTSAAPLPDVAPARLCLQRSAGDAVKRTPFCEPDSSLSAFAAWDTSAYLAEYYSHVEHDEQLTLEFLVQEFGRIAPGATALVFGAGPALHHLLPLAPRVEEIMRPTTCMRISQRFGAGSIASPARMTGGPSRGMCWSAKAMPSRASSISAGVKR